MRRARGQGLSLVLSSRELGMYSCMQAKVRRRRLDHLVQAYQVKIKIITSHLEILRIVEGVISGSVLALELELVHLYSLHLFNQMKWSTVRLVFILISTLIPNPGLGGVKNAMGR